MFLPLHDDNPLEVIPFQAVTVSLIAACVLVHAALALTGDLATAHHAYGVIPAVLLDAAELSPELERLPAEATIVTAMFVHAGWLHLGGNMLYLWVFGDNVEDALGHLRFALFYLSCGAVAALVHVAVAPQATAPMVGASGAVAGVLGAYLVLHPRARVLVLALNRLPLRLPARWLLAAWIAWQVGAALLSEQRAVAWWAHVAGFAAGAVLAVALRSRRSGRVNA